MIEVDVPATSSAGAALSDRYPSIAISRQSHSSMEADNEAPESNFQSAYYAPPYPRPQADRDHQQESLLQDRARGDLTAHNLELIPDADHVAPGIRLDRGGNDYPFQRGARNETRQENTRENEHVVGGGEVALDSGHPNDKRSSLGGKTLSSIGAATGRSSNGGLDAEVEGIEGDAHVDESGDLFEDVNEDLDDDVVFDEKNVAIVHERVGGSGATSENASKGTSVGHFGPRGEAIRESIVLFYSDESHLQSLCFIRFSGSTSSSRSSSTTLSSAKSRCCFCSVCCSTSSSFTETSWC